MAIRRGAVSCSRFRLQGDAPKDMKRWVLKALTSNAFEPIDLKSDEERAAGFVELHDGKATSFAAGTVFEGGFAVCSWRVEKITIPAMTLRNELVQWSTKFEQKNGRPAGRREKAEQKEAIRKAMRAKAEPSVKIFDISWELESGEINVWASSRAVVDEVQTAFEGALEVRLVPRVPASFVSPAVLDRMSITPELFAMELR